MSGRLGFIRQLSKLDLAVLGALLIGLVLVVYAALIGVTGDERANIPALIESVGPPPDAVQAPAQTSVTADLAEGYTGVFVIDGVEIETVDIGDFGSVTQQPGVQVDLPPVTIFEPGNNTLTFTPSSAAAIESFDSGEHEVRLIYWELDVGRQRARTYTWVFNVI